jgi:solute carrier family 25 (adenine nucleotide translocator) protein 4/5/6/31
MRRNKKKEPNFLVKILMGGVYAGMSKTILAPIERVKLLLQVQDANRKIAVDQRYNGIKDCFSRVLKEQGRAAFWRGNMANVIRFFPAQAITFACKDFYNQILNPVNPKTHPKMFFIGNC